MKKLLALMLCGVLAFGLAACGDSASAGRLVGGLVRGFLGGPPPPPPPPPPAVVVPQPVVIQQPVMIQQTTVTVLGGRRVRVKIDTVLLRVGRCRQHHQQYVQPVSQLSRLAMRISSASSL